MPVNVEISTVPEPELESLQDWLLQEPELRRSVKVLKRAPAEGELGGVVEALSVAVGAGGALSVLAASLRVWFAQPRRSDVHIRVRDVTGRTVKVDAKNVKDVEAVLRRVIEPTGQL